jgi:hypothetical protein
MFYILIKAFYIAGILVHGCLYKRDENSAEKVLMQHLEISCHKYCTINKTQDIEMCPTMCSNY